MATRPKAVIESRNGEKFSPITIAKNVLTDDGQNLHDILSDRKEDMMTPTIENSSSMFKVGQGDNVDYSENVVDGAYESCVFKGKSLVNLLTKTIDTTWNLNLENWSIVSTTPSDYVLKPSTTYSVIVYVTEKTCPDREDLFWVGDVDGKKDKVTHDIVRKNVSLGANVFVINTVPVFSSVTSTKNGGICFQGSKFVEGTLKWKAIVLEGDWTNKELPPYFEGICDCKSPILSNCGKNLFDWEAHHWRLNRFQWSHGDGGLGNGNALGRAGVEWVSIKTLKLKPNQTYYTNGYISFYENDGQGLCIGGRVHNGVFTVPTNAEIACVSTLINDGVKLEYMSDPKIIISEIEMEYEPYKSNILSCNGDKIELTEDMFEQGGVYFTKGQSFADATNNTAPDRIRLKTLLNLKPNTTYRVAIDNAYKVGVQLYNNEESAVSDTGWVSDATFTTKGGEKAVALVVRKLSPTANISMSDFKNIKLQLSEVDKTIVLRSLPNGVCDTLNIETGEYVQRIGEVMLDGSDDESWSTNNTEGTTTNRFISPRLQNSNVDQTTGVGQFLCDKLKTETWSQTSRLGLTINGQDVFIYNASIDYTASAIKQWLSQNPVTVQYELATPIVKQINVEGYPYAYENGHILLESGSQEQSLTPKVEYSVVTNRNGQIRSNQKMVERHQKQLDRLQAMVLTNLVNTQYEQTLTNLKYDLKNVREEVK